MKKKEKGTKWVKLLGENFLLPDVKESTYKNKNGPWSKNSEMIKLEMWLIWAKSSWFEKVYNAVNKPR
ncbi:MAG: hypothetical protein K0B09_07700 [Bacteroidales bacterium]|nr:hypothetical protein [Bacteroidales bacterium]